MDDDEAERVARAMLRDGASIGQVMRHFESKMGAMYVLMRLAPIALKDARSMVMAFDDGELVFEHMRLADLEYLARVLGDGGHSLVGSHLADAIKRGHRQRWFARGNDLHWRMTFSASETENLGATSATLEELRAAIADPMWREDVRVVRDERDLVVLEFPRVTAA